MNARLFSEAISEIGDKYYMEAATYQARSAKRPGVTDLSIVGSTHNSEQRKRPGLRLVTRIIIAAALLLALSITAYAVYQATIKDYIIPPTEESETHTTSPEITEELSRANISLVGYQGTPEYEAYVEWNNWWEESQDPRVEMGVNDAWHDTPDNYYKIYGASFQEQADKLDQIIEKYDLALHTGEAPLERGEQYDTRGAQSLYEALGTKPFISSPYTSSSGYVYDDGSFKLDCENWDDETAQEVFSFSMALNVKGSFFMISSSFPTDYEEWSYNTASGVTVDLVQSANESAILAETEGSYIIILTNYGSQALYPMELAEDDPHYAQVHMSQEEYYSMLRENEPGLTDEGFQERYDLEASWETYRSQWEVDTEQPLRGALSKAELEAFADSIDFSVLAEKFDGTPLDLTEELAILQAENEAFLEEWYAAHDPSYQFEPAFESDEERDAYVVAQLGDWHPDAPTGYTHRYSRTEYYDGRNETTRWSDEPLFGDVMYSYYTADDDSLSFFLIYSRYYTSSDRTETANQEYFNGLKNHEFFDGNGNYYQPGKECTVNGYDAWYILSGELESESQLEWLDTDRDLIFSLYLSPAQTERSEEEMINLAEELIQSFGK